MPRVGPGLFGVVLAAIGGCGRAPIGSASQPIEASGWFVDRSNESGLDRAPIPTEESPLLGTGVAVGDVDGDGLPDIVARSGAHGDTVVYRNQGGFVFTPLGAPLPKAQGFLLVDLDGDGDQDLVLAGPKSSGVYENDGHGAFTLRASGDALLPQASTIGVAAIDADGDGAIDPFFYAYDAFAPEAESSRSHLARNGGDFSFADGSATGLSMIRLTWAVAWFDADGDGLPDLYAASDTGLGDPGFGPPTGNQVALPDMLFRAKAGSPRTYEDGAAAAGLGEARGSMSAIVGDFDRDGRLDLYVSNQGKNRLFSNRGDGTFEDRTDEAGIGATRLERSDCPATSTEDRCLLTSWGAALFDADHDGLDDLVVVNGALLPPEAQPASTFRGLGGGRFAAVEMGLPSRGGRALVAADLDGDGDLDLVSTTHGGALLVFENRATHDDRWLRVAARGTTSNRDGIGATATLTLDDGTTVVRPIGAGGVAQSSAPYEAHFTWRGAKPQMLVVRFPSGAIATVDSVPLGKSIVVSEP